MALRMDSKFDGPIRFYREPLRSGGGVLALLPGHPDNPRRLALVWGDGYYYEEVDMAYVRLSCRPAGPGDESEARRMLREIDQRSEYLRTLAAEAG